MSLAKYWFKNTEKCSYASFTPTVGSLEHRLQKTFGDNKIFLQVEKFPAKVRNYYRILAHWFHWVFSVYRWTLSPKTWILTNTLRVQNGNSTQWTIPTRISCTLALHPISRTLHTLWRSNENLYTTSHRWEHYTFLGLRFALQFLKISLFSWKAQSFLRVSLFWQFLAKIKLEESFCFLYKKFLSFWKWALWVS